MKLNFELQKILNKLCHYISFKFSDLGQDHAQDQFTDQEHTLGHEDEVSQSLPVDFLKEGLAHHVDHCHLDDLAL